MNQNPKNQQKEAIDFGSFAFGAKTLQNGVHR